MKHKKQKTIVEVLDSLSKKELSATHDAVIDAGLLYETGNDYKMHFKKLKNSTMSKTLKQVYSVLERLSTVELDSVLTDVLEPIQ